MKNFILVIIVFVAMNKAYGTQDTLLMKSLVRNVFDAKQKLEGGEFLSKQNWPNGSLRSETIETLFTKRGITTNLDSLSKAYDFHIKQIKDKKVEFLNYYSNLSNLGKAPYFFYDYQFPYSSYLDPRLPIPYVDGVKIVKHFIIYLDRDRLPSLDEAVRYLEGRK